MFTISIAGLAGIIAASLGFGVLFGLFLGACLAVSGGWSEDEERNPWPGETQ